MRFGFAIRQPSGRLWMSPDVTPMNLIERLTITAAQGATLTTSVPKNIPIIIFVNYAKKVSAYQFEKIEVSGFHAYKLSGGIFYGEGSSESQIGNYTPCQMTVYVFAAMAKNLSRYGLNLYNALGVLIYSAQMRPLQLFNYPTNHSMTMDSNMKEPVAVVPMCYSQVTEFDHYGLHSLYWFSSENYWTAACGNNLYNSLTAGYLYPYFDGMPGHDPYGSSALSGFFYIKTAIYDK